MHALNKYKRICSMYKETVVICYPITAEHGIKSRPKDGLHTYVDDDACSGDDVSEGVWQEVRCLP